MLSLAGCDKLFGIDDVHLTDARPIDASRGPTLACAGPTTTMTCRTVMPSLVADTFLDPSRADVTLGSGDAVHIGNNTPTLLKFSLTGASALGPTDCLGELKLTITPAIESFGCLSPADPYCEYCAFSYEGIDLHWMTSDWIESEATYNDAKTTTPWHAGGAGLVPDDRSDVVVTTARSGTGPVVIDILAPGLAQVDPGPYVTDHLGILLTAVNGVGAFESYEGATKPVGAGCDNGPGTSLELTICSP
ncbi:MAG: hypothetical protein JWO36_2945 [Myxococcales bacterium]|nr:hypothetical protein [Myxococcales bacterium]